MFILYATILALAGLGAYYFSVFPPARPGFSAPGGATTREHTSCVPPTMGNMPVVGGTGSGTRSHKQCSTMFAVKKMLAAHICTCSSRSGQTGDGALRSLSPAFDPTSCNACRKM